MDMSFANQFLSLIRLAAEGRSLGAGVHDIPESQDQMLAGLKLRTLGVAVDSLTPEQIRYQDDYASGT
jgi:adenosylhomocysteinase